MIKVTEVIDLNRATIDVYGGSFGIRDLGALEAAVARPFQTVFGQDAYPDVLAKISAALQALIINHPFIDGNKRTGILFALLIAERSGHDVEYDMDFMFELVNWIAINNPEVNDIINFINNYKV